MIENEQKTNQELIDEVEWTDKINQRWKLFYIFLLYLFLIVIVVVGFIVRKNVIDNKEKKP